MCMMGTIKNKRLKEIIDNSTYIKEAVEKIIPKTGCILGINYNTGIFELYNDTLGLIIYSTGIPYRNLESLEEALVNIYDKFLTHNKNQISEEDMWKSIEWWKDTANRYIYEKEKGEI